MSARRDVSSVHSASRNIGATRNAILAAIMHAHSGGLFTNHSERASVPDI